MKKKAKLKLSKKDVKNLKLKLKRANDRKAAPLLIEEPPTNGHSC